MNKLLKMAASGLIAFSMAGGMAAAADCSIVNGNGSGSTNSCENNENQSFTYKCENEAYVVNVNGQLSGSGSVNVSDNTTGGYVVSGDANNYNNTVNELDLSCVPTETTSTPTTPEKPEVKSEQTTKPAVESAALPETGTSPAAVTVVAAIALGGAAVATQLGVKAFKLFRS
jgi:hypothetical protein